MYSLCHKKFEIDTINFLNATNHISPVATVSITSQKPWNHEGSNDGVSKLLAEVIQKGRFEM